MTGYSAITLTFDHWFVSNLQLLEGKVHYLFKDRLPEDQKTELLHDLYVKMKTRIQQLGYEGDFMPYFFGSLRNELRQWANKRKHGKRRFEPLYFRDTNVFHYTHNNGTDVLFELDFTTEVETTLQNNDTAEDERQTIRHERQCAFLADRVLIFVQQHFNEKEFNLFRLYYLSENKRETYKSLTKNTGYSFKYVEFVIMNIKKKIRTDFNDWVREDFENYLKANE